MVVIVDLQLPVQSVPITTKVVNSNPVHEWQHYVIELQQNCGFPRVLRFPPPIKVTATI